MFSHGVAASLIASAAFASHVLADSVVLTNGDTLHGKIGAVTASGLKLNSDALGDITIQTAKVASYKIDEPVVVQMKDGPPVTAAVSGDAKQIQVGDEAYTFDTVKSVNPPPSKWTGAVLANFALARGNTNKSTVGVDAKAGYRREDYLHNDRLTLEGQYNFGQSGGGAGGEEVVTDTDNFQLAGKYDKFWTQKFYGYVTNKIEHDRIADLYYRLGPNAGVGYQWVETPVTNFFTETGVGYVFERFDDGTNNDYASLRLAYHFERALGDKVAAFHNLEYLPSIENPGDYNLKTDAGIRVKIFSNFIGQFKIEYKRDSTPANEALKNDLLYLVGFGWQF
jgi:putative salt-induced outer membrane protein YdiY